MKKGDHNITECPNECCGHNNIMNAGDFRCVDCVNTITITWQNLQVLLEKL